VNLIDDRFSVSVVTGGLDVVEFPDGVIVVGSPVGPGGGGSTPLPERPLRWLSDVEAPADTPAGNVLGTSGEGVWEPLPLAYLQEQTVGPLQAEIGDPSLLDFGVPEHDLVHFLIELDSRLDAIDGGTLPPPALEGALEVDNYSGGFIRVRDTGGLLSDGQVHHVNVVLATVAGPGGVVITDPPGIPAGASPVWFDDGGSLGYIVGTTGTNVTQTTLRNWAKFSNPASASYYQLAVRRDVTDPAHPRLIVESVADIRASTTLSLATIGTRLDAIEARLTALETP
jgi:hypothetical protein